jgi:hypothetical protein
MSINRRLFLASASSIAIAGCKSNAIEQLPTFDPISDFVAIPERRELNLVATGPWEPLPIGRDLQDLLLRRGINAERMGEPVRRAFYRSFSGDPQILRWRGRNWSSTRFEMSQIRSSITYIETGVNDDFTTATLDLTLSFLFEASDTHFRSRTSDRYRPAMLSLYLLDRASSVVPNGSFPDFSLHSFRCRNFGPFSYSKSTTSPVAFSVIDGVRLVTSREMGFSDCR